MLLHLPIVVLASFSPVAVSDTIPKFDIAKECRFEGESSTAVGRCSHDETEAYQKLQAEWPQFDGASRSACLAEATSAGFASYVDLLICLEMARDVAKNEKANAGEAPAKTGSQPMQPPPPETSVVDKHD
jgi:hypothetical protein